MIAKNKFTKASLDKLPPAAAYSKANFPSLEQQGVAKEVITKQWDAVVGATVK
jgi:putative spermidine/putrescine transport system substrate-binding protein